MAKVNRKIPYTQVIHGTAETFEVAGTHAIDLSVLYQKITLTGATVFSVINPPANGYGYTISILLSGNFGATLPAEFLANLTGDDLDLSTSDFDIFVNVGNYNNVVKYTTNIQKRND